MEGLHQGRGIYETQAAYYIKLNSDCDQDGNITLHDKLNHRPENCRGVSQKTIGIHASSNPLSVAEY